MVVETKAQRLEREAAIRQHVQKQQRALTRINKFKAMSRSGNSEMGMSDNLDSAAVAEAEEIEAEDEACTLWVGNMPGELLQVSTLRISQYNLGGNEDQTYRPPSPRSIDKSGQTRRARRPGLDVDVENANYDYPVLHSMFGRYGVIENIEPRIKAGKNKSWALIRFTDAKAVQRAVNAALESPQLMRVPPKGGLSPGGHQIHVRNIGWDGRDGTKDGIGDSESERALREIFQPFGEFWHATVRHRIEKGKNTSWALVTMGTALAVDRVLAAPEVRTPAGTVLKVTKFDNKQAVDSSGGMKAIKTGALLIVKTCDTKGELERKQNNKQEGALANVWQSSRALVANNFGFNPAQSHKIQPGFSQVLQVAVDYAVAKNSPNVPASVC